MLTDALAIACWLAALDVVACGERIVDVQIEYDSEGLRAVRFEYDDEER